MKANDVIKTIMKKRNLTQMDLLKLTGMVSQSGLSAKLNRDMKVSSAAELVELLNCELIIRDPSTGEEYRITE